MLTLNKNCSFGVLCSRSLFQADGLKPWTFPVQNFPFMIMQVITLPMKALMMEVLTMKASVMQVEVEDVIDIIFRFRCFLLFIVVKRYSDTYVCILGSRYPKTTVSFIYLL